MESEARRRFVDRLEALGCLVLPLEPSATNGLDEYPDVVVLGRDGKCALVEFKRPPGEGVRAGRLRPGQRKTLASLTARGYYARVHDNERGVGEVARAVGVIPC